jgi:phage terminase large subunit-like protein
MISTKDKAAQERYRLLVQHVTSNTFVNPLETTAEKQHRMASAKQCYNSFVNLYCKHYATAPCAPFHIALANAIKKNNRCKYLLGWGRGLAKSTHLNILIPLWLWINGDIRVMLLVGQNQDKADVLLGDIQAEFEGNQLLINDFGAQRTLGSWEIGKFVTKNDCAFFALGMGQSPRGLRHRQYRPDYIVADDLDTKEVCRNPKRIRQAAAWICEDLLGTMDERGSRYIQVNNVFSTTTILTYIRDKKEGFIYNRQNATDAQGNPTWPAKNTREFYDTQRQAMGTLSFEAEYNNNPYTEGTIFTESMIHWAPVPRIDRYDSLVAFWDVAYSNADTADFNAIKIWGLKDGTYYLIKAFVRQCNMEDALTWMNTWAQLLPPNLHINWYYESQFWNDALRMVKAHVDARFAYPINLIKSTTPKGAKYDRIINLLPYYQQGKIIYNINEQRNADMQVGIAQLLGIEPGYHGHDDSPDADAQAIDKLSRRQHHTATRYVVHKPASRKF